MFKISKAALVYYVIYYTLYVLSKIINIAFTSGTLGLILEVRA